MNDNEAIPENFDDETPAEFDLTLLKNGARGKYYARMQESAKANTMAEQYPHIEKWIFSGGRIELGQSDYTPALAQALDEGGIIWEGEARYETLHAMLAALEAGIAAWNEENQ